MRFGLVQFSPIWESKEDSILEIEKLIKQTNMKFDVLIFPELTLTGFTMDSKTHSEEIDGIGYKYFLELARKTKTHIFAGLVGKHDSKFYNELIHFDKNGLIEAVYQKIHPFSYSKEDRYYFSGKETVVTKIDKYKIGLSICYDLRFPELYRFYGKEKVDLIINIANWPIPRIEHWTKLLNARAIENQCFAIGVNRMGSDPYLQYNGMSVAFDPMGKKLNEQNDKSGIIIVEFNLEEAKKTQDKFPFLDDIKLI